MEYSEQLIDSLWRSISMIEAQEQLKLISAVNFPNEKKSDKKTKHKELHGLAYPNELKPKNYVSLEDVQKALGR